MVQVCGSKTSFAVAEVQKITAKTPQTCGFTVADQPLLFCGICGCRIECKFAVPTQHCAKCHIPKEINGFLKKLYSQVTFILINETFNSKRLFTFKERQTKLRRSSVIYRITCSRKSTYTGQTSRNLISRFKNHDPTSRRVARIWKRGGGAFLKE